MSHYDRKQSRLATDKTGSNNRRELTIKMDTPKDEGAEKEDYFDGYLEIPAVSKESYDKQIPQVEDIRRYRGAQIASQELWSDSHLNLLVQSKYFNLYSRRRAIRPKLKIDAAVRISTATKIVYDQLHSEGLERL
ncbi:hypothetical protein M0R45_017295 [Rubus argutus]|uniref:Uncharacterized protein n=1 Tax=Rubus argutus TaxID=59490 RepID=A0AAW1XX42_RUBAR